jgi:hypothetical protein
MNLLRLVTADSLSHNCIGRYILMEMHLSKWGYAVALLVETLRHKPVGRGFDSDGGLGSTQSLTDLNTKNISQRVKAVGA